jgi:hypothetical protein
MMATVMQLSRNLFFAFKFFAFKLRDDGEEFFGWGTSMARAKVERGHGVGLGRHGISLLYRKERPLRSIVM